MNKKLYGPLDNMPGASADAGDNITEFTKDQSSTEAQKNAKELSDGMTDLQKYEAAKQDKPAKVAAADAKAFEAFSNINIA